MLRLPIVLLAMLIFADQSQSCAFANPAVHFGRPEDAVGCDGSLTIGDPIGAYGVNLPANLKAASPGSIVDINEIVDVNSFRLPMQNVAPVGWVYKDDRSLLYWALNPKASAFLPRRSIQFFKHYGLLPYNGPIAVGHKVPPLENAGMTLRRCWSEGLRFRTALYRSPDYRNR